jgi:hypothetical protein
LASAQAVRQIVNGCDHNTRHEEVAVYSLQIKRQATQRLSGCKR